jgi:flagellar biosynthesis protein FlhB
MAERDQKTEQPTQRRMLKAREEGNFPSAQIFVGALQFLTFVAMLRFWGAGWIGAVHQTMAMLLRHALGTRLDSAFLMAAGLQLGKHVFMPLLITGAALLGVTLAAQFLVTRLGVSLKKLAPDLKRLSPMARLKQLPRQNIPALLQALVMLPVFSWTVYMLVKDDFVGFLSLPLQSVSVGAGKVGASIQTLLWKASCVFLVFGAVDLFRQQRRYQSDLKMSKQEIRDELKEVEGNPLMKSRIRRIRRDVARRRMMHEIATATAVVVNPTHYAVALRYDAKSPGAPMVVAKGKNYLALRIRKRATEAMVPLIENPPLAQGLYKSVDVGQEIPAQFYRAVAEILAYIYRLMNGRVPA